MRADEARNSVALITDHVAHWEFRQALAVYQEVRRDGGLAHLTGSVLVALLKACSTLKDVEQGGLLHFDISKRGRLKSNVYVGCALVDMYAKCGALSKAEEVFNLLPVRTVVLWTALITAYVQYGYGSKALQCLEQMQQEGLSSDAVTFSCGLKACSNLRAIDKGKELHIDLTRKGLDKETVVGSTLVDMYAKCGLLAEAQKVFDLLPARDVISWTALIAGYSDHGHGKEALSCFKKMRQAGLRPDAVTYVCGLKACGLIKASNSGRAIHAQISKQGLEMDLMVGSTLVDMYAKCGCLTQAQIAFDKLPTRDVVLWTSLMDGYGEHGNTKAALSCLEQMRRHGISPTGATFVCGLKACSSLGSTIKIQELHHEVIGQGLESELLVGNTLIDVFAKAGLLEDAKQVLNTLPVRDVISWTTLITGYAQQGETENVFLTYDKMVSDGIKPNLATFVNVLNACSHAGLVEKGQHYFDALCNEYRLVPNLDHYTCMIDLLARAGHTGKVLSMVKKMPFHPGIVVWHIVLAASRKWGNVELAVHAFEHALRMDERDHSAYVAMFNIYADASMHEEANKIEALRIKNQAWIRPGQESCSLVASG